MQPVRWGFVGAGIIATHVVAPAVHAAVGADLYAAAARDPERAAGLLPVGPAYPSYDALLEDAAVDAVYISLNNDAHTPWTIAALEAGKHVLCEKPLGLTAGEVDEMTAAADRVDRLLVEASMYRWHPRTRLAERLVREGAIGQVRHVAAGFGFDGVQPGNYRHDVAKGGGALYDVGCYAVSAALWAFGQTPVLDVAAQLHRADSEVDLAADVIVSFGGGHAELHAGMAEAFRQWLVITGDAGEIELPMPFTSDPGRGSELLLFDGRGTERMPVDPANSYVLMAEAVSAAVRGDHAYVVPLAESRAVAATIDAALAAANA